MKLILQTDNYNLTYHKINLFCKINGKQFKYYDNCNKNKYFK